MFLLKSIIHICLALISINVYPQTKILFTAIDYSTGEVRATICDESGNNRHDLAFNKTYLPVWFGEKILLNSDNFIWQCDTTGENLTQLFLGYRASVSNNIKMTAFYTETGINIADEKGKIIKQIFVNTLNDAAITWSRNDDKISYFDPEKHKCFLFNLSNDSIEVFGDSIFHPLWNPKAELVLFNKAVSDGRYDIVVKDERTNTLITINQKNENAVVPIWSNNGKKIAYLAFRDNATESENSDLYPCRLIIYDINQKKSVVAADDAGFTDKAFPQMCFDENDEYIYYTKINDIGLGSLARVNLKNFVEETISKNSYIDERFPQIKIFK